MIDLIAACRWQLRVQMSAEADRLARAIWWGRYDEENAMRELRSMVKDAVARAKYPKQCTAIAAAILAEALETLEAQYRPIVDAIKDAVLEVLGRGQPRSAAEKRACDIAAAAAAEILLPPVLVRRAIDIACRIHAWRRKQQQAEASV
jgi:hypothetical protein